MEIFITLTKYITRQWREEGKPLLEVHYLILLIFYHVTIVSNVLMKNEIYPSLFIGMVYNIFLDQPSLSLSLYIYIYIYLEIL